MEEEIEEKGISIGDIFRTIFSQKWLALIIAVVITIVGTVGIYFYGKNKTEYSIEFILDLPGADESPASYRYPDGKLFNYTEFVSVEFLEEVKATSNEFTDIEVEKMVKEGGIKISRTLTETAEGTGEYAASYKLNIKSKYFKDGDSARDFMVAVAGYPVTYIAEMKIDYDYSITASQNALTYEAQLTELENQVRSLQSLYNSFINSYGGDFKVELEDFSQSLTKLKNDSVDEYLNKGLFTSLKNEALENGYVKSTENTRERDKYQSDWFTANEKLTVAQNTLDRLLELQSNTGSIIYADSIRAQIIEVEQLKLDLSHIQSYLDKYDAGGNVNGEFDAKVKAVEAEVLQLTEGIKPIADYVYKNVAKVNIPEANKITAEGGFGLVMSAAASLVAGIIIAAIVAYIVGWNKQKKAVATVKLPHSQEKFNVFAEAQAQMAATESNEVKDGKEDKEDKK